ncbi:MAG: UDP-N-acetylmuramate dehydrogenase [Dialister sp.]|nr:UDP-N-acetylmuramate dehydrogenase [Dialister sp.]
MDGLQKDLFLQFLRPGQIRENEPMSRHTTFGIGGPADLFLMPSTPEELQLSLKAAKKAGISVFVVGGGANLLVRDKGIRGIVIHTGHLRYLKVRDHYMIVSAGMSTAEVARAALGHHLSGLEFASGIPGTIGGAAYMNAGAYGSEMAEVIVSATICDSDGNLRRYGKADINYGYRHSRFMGRSEVILDITLSLKPGDEAGIKARMDELNGRRRLKQPLDKRSAGSTFKRPAGHFTGKMIEELGLKGFSVGDARVSEKHAGFLINDGHASCRDMMALIAEVQRQVKEAYHVDLRPEVQIVGEE